MSHTTTAPHADALRRSLLEQLASAPDDVISRHAGIVRDVLCCPSWCVNDHAGSEEVDSLGSHASEAVAVACSRPGRKQQSAVLLAVESAGAYGDGVVRIAMDDNMYTAEQARNLARVLVEHADRIDGDQ